MASTRSKVSERKREREREREDLDADDVVFVSVTSLRTRKKSNGDGDGDGDEEVMVSANLKTNCLVCQKGIDPRGGVPISLPGCCGVQLHQPCLVHYVTTSATSSPVCPACKKGLPASIIPSTVTSSVQIPVKSRFPASFHVYEKWDKALSSESKSKSFFWESSTSSFTECFKVRGQILHHSLSSRDINPIINHEKSSADFKPLVYLDGFNTETIKAEIVSHGPVVSRSYKPNIGRADEKDCPIILGWKSLDMLGEVWIVKKRSTGDKEFHVAVGTLNIEYDIAVPAEDLSQTKWQLGPYLHLDTGGLGEKWMSKTETAFTHNMATEVFMRLWRGIDGATQRKSVRITGITGCTKQGLNGIYEPTEETCEGVTVFRLRGDANVWLEYGCGGLKKWMIKPTAEKGKDVCWANVDVGSVCLPDSIPSPSIWSVFGANKEWIDAAGVTVSLVVAKYTAQDLIAEKPFIEVSSDSKASDSRLGVFDNFEPLGDKIAVHARFCKR